MSYAYRQKKKRAARAQRLNNPPDAIGRPRKKVETGNPSLILSRMADAVRQKYWDYIRENHKKFGGPKPVRIEIAAIVAYQEAYQDHLKDEKRKKKRGAA